MSEFESLEFYLKWIQASRWKHAVGLMALGLGFGVLCGLEMSDPVALGRALLIGAGAGLAFGAILVVIWLLRSVWRARIAWHGDKR